ncbi:MAG: hypothetical protein ACWGKN_03305 [Desulfoprunum sp.]
MGKTAGCLTISSNNRWLGNKTTITDYLTAIFLVEPKTGGQRADFEYPCQVISAISVNQAIISFPNLKTEGVPWPGPLSRSRKLFFRCFVRKRGKTEHLQGAEGQCGGGFAPVCEG